MNPNIWDGLLRFSPWALLAFAILFVLYQKFLPGIVKTFEASQEYMKQNAEAQRTMLADQLGRVENARKEELIRFAEMMAKRDTEAKEIHKEQMAAMAAITAEVRSMGERLPARNNRS